MKRSLVKRTQKSVASPTSKTKDMKLQNEIIKFDRQPSKSISCPSLKLARKNEQNLTLRQTSSVFHIRESLRKCRLLPNYMEINFLQIRAASTNATEKTANAAKSIGSVCACPCPSSCLPPPCNTPAKCLQYMTGYYYYPYGTWFCGPYHVSTGSCPCAGPVKPGGPCGPILPCPGDPCGPPCCKPLTCCGVCGLGGPFQSNDTSNTYNPWNFGSANMYSCYNPYTPNPYTEYNAYNPYNSYMPHGYYNNFNGMQMPPNFGPCYNVPITPVPVANPMTSEWSQTTTHSGNQTNSSAPKTSICWPLSKANINQDTKVSSSKNPTNYAPSSSTQNLSPNPIRFSPSSSYIASKPSLSKTNPYTKPRINARTLQQSNSIGVCYFSTKYIKKYAHKGRKLSANNLSHGAGPQSGVAGTVKELNEAKKNAFNYWSLLSNGNNRKNET